MDQIFAIQTKAEDLNAYVKELWPLIEGREMSLVSPALIMILLSIQAPELVEGDQARLLEGIKEVSGYIAMYLSGAAPGPGGVN